MDYFDPVRKKARIRRLYLGYFLTAIAIGLATLILVFVGSGYVPGQDGLVQNGLLYINSTPGGSTITLNGKTQRDKTEARLVLPGATYDIQLSKDKYRPWTRTIQLEDGKVRRIAYPRLYPVSLKTNIVQTANIAPDVTSGSIDRRFILLHYPNSQLVFQLMSTERPYDAPVSLAIPTALVNSPEKTAQYSVIEWTEDSHYILVKRAIEGSNEYLLLDKDSPGTVRNLTRDMGLRADTDLNFRDRSAEKYVAFSPSLKTVQFRELSNPAAATTVAENVLQQTSFEDDKLLFVAPHPTNPEKVRVRLREGGKTYEIRDLQKANAYVLEIAKFGKALVLLVGSPPEQKASVFRNPTAYLRSNPDKTFPLATATLRVNKLQYGSFSGDASAVIVYGDGEFASHEFEADRSYSFKTALPIDPAIELRWMDNARLNFVSDDSVYSVDFDGSNIEKLVAGRARYGVYFDRDYKSLYSFLTNKDGSLFQVTSTALFDDN